MAGQVSHKRPESLERVEKGSYRVRGTELRIVQDGESGKWKVTGHADDLGAFKNRQGALDKLQELNLVPEVPAEQADKPEGDGNRTTGRKPRTRKEPAKASA